MKKYFKVKTNSVYDTIQTVYCCAILMDDCNTNIYFYDKSRAIVGIVHSDKFSIVELKADLLKGYYSGNYEGSFYSDSNIVDIQNFFNTTIG